MLSIFNLILRFKAEGTAFSRKPMKFKYIITPIFIAIILAVAFKAWTPGISRGLPYFYDEDEAHHYTRVVNMVKSGDFNPHYFRKPSLHFYLRMPAVAAGFLTDIKKGRIRKLSEIVTDDEFGIARYPLSASHSGIVKYARGVSLLCGLVMVLCTYLLLGRFSRASPVPSFMASLMVVLSPIVVQYSSVVGVDIVMGATVILAVFVSILLYENLQKSNSKGRQSNSLVILSGVTAGLAISSKYNALPILAVPCAVSLLYSQGLKRITNLFIICISSVFGFFLASPFILTELPVFLDQFGYEIWHYGVAGHEGHTAEPGLPQFLFYVKWFYGSDLGIGALVAGAFGICFALYKSFGRSLVVLTFPVLYFALMCSQKANFTRNMLPIIPFLAFFVSVGLYGIYVTLKQRISMPISSMVLGAIFIGILFQPFLRTFQFVNQIEAELINESRTKLEAWLKNKSQDKGLRDQVFIDGRLKVSPSIKNIKGVRVADFSKEDQKSFFLRGYNKLVVGSRFDSSTSSQEELTLQKTFAGNDEEQRIPINPTIKVYSISKNNDLSVYNESKEFLSFGDKLGFIVDGFKKDFKKESAEGHLWVNSKLSRLRIPSYMPSGKRCIMSIVAMTPWENQKISIVGGSDSNTSTLKEAGAWKDLNLSFSIPEKPDQPLALMLSKASSPKLIFGTGDNRVLGIGVRSVEVKCS